MRIFILLCAACAASRTAVSLSDGKLDLDYMIVDRHAGLVWVPAGGTGSVAIIDTKTLHVSKVGGFPVSQTTIGGRTFLLGPTAIALGDGVAYVGNRGDSTVCTIDLAILKRGACVRLGSDLASSADGLAFVLSAHELWVTRGAPPLGIMPKDLDLLVFDSSLHQKARVPLSGAAEGYAVDDAHGLFYTNLADKDLTVAVDVASHSVRAQWPAGCGSDGPRGIAVDSARQLVLVACTDRVVALDAARDGAELSSLPVGAGVDNIDYVESRQELFVAAAASARLTVVHVGERGTLSAAWSAETRRYARVVVADEQGDAFVGDPAGGGVLVFRHRT